MFGIGVIFMLAALLIALEIFLASRKSGHWGLLLPFAVYVFLIVTASQLTNLAVAAIWVGILLIPLVVLLAINYIFIRKRDIRNLNGVEKMRLRDL